MIKNIYLLAKYRDCLDHYSRQRGAQAVVTVEPVNTRTGKANQVKIYSPRLSSLTLVKAASVEVAK